MAAAVDKHGCVHVARTLVEAVRKAVAANRSY